MTDIFLRFCSAAVEAAAISDSCATSSKLDPLFIRSRFKNWNNIFIYRLRVNFNGVSARRNQQRSD